MNGLLVGLLVSSNAVDSGGVFIVWHDPNSADGLLLCRVTGVVALM